MKQSFVFKMLSLLIVMGKGEVPASEGNDSKVALYGYGGDGPISEFYQKEAVELGKFLSDEHIVPISGCLSGQGNIYKTIESCMNNGGSIEGVVNKASDLPMDAPIQGDKFYVDNYEQVKKHMLVNGKAFIFLPSGIGGLGAILDILLLKEMGAHDKPIYFYNEKFWQFILTNLEEMVGPLPKYHIINHGSQMIHIAQGEDNMDQKMIDEFFDQQYEARHSHSVCNPISLINSKISLQMLNDILEVYYARIEGIHDKVIFLNGSDRASQENAVVFGISPWRPLKEILNHLYQEGFMKDEYLEMIQFND